MIDYNDSSTIAWAVYNNLNMPDDLGYNAEVADAIEKQYLRDDSLIKSLVLQELENYDTTGNRPEDIDDLVERAVDEVFFMISDATDAHYRYEQSVAENAYNQIVSILQNANIENVVDVDAEYDPADYSVGIYDEERYIQFRLSTGQYIVFNVEFLDAEK